ncbi:substrate-binding domain-containing protein [Kitasatospora sp. NBC_00458]|uniref:substrate-binding domain-containing protein n=1 Tax=Kitasatospora sp. NBC_00458 TaxID=2903568 RepID=UPI002E1788B6
MRSTTVRVFTALTAAVCGAVLAAPAAVADPPPGVVPAAVDLVGVGVDTTQGFMNQTSSDYNAVVAPVLPKLYSWDVTGINPITPKTGAVSIARPDGSGQGLTALAINTAATVNYSRSSRGPVAGDPTPYTFVPFARDAVTWSAKAGGNAPANLTTAQLKGIYECSITSWAQISASLPNVAIKPYLPPAISDTRTAFLKAIAVSTPGVCVTAGPRNDRGIDPVLNDANVVFPYSVGTYVAQVYRGHGTAVESPGPLTLRSINGIAPVNASNSINPAFLGTVYGRTLYNIVRTGEYTATTPYATALKSVFGPQGWICAHPAVIVDYGFVPIAACGSTVTT